ncbi:MAG: fumarylacetoacetate hydrolase family protein, partial [Rhodospirillaceae bacterium]|nr:fumarylacetoacetate hydrolase family protein [Rhodospirillaceae bacterium]
PGVTADEVLAATEGLAACFEIVDSRIRDWRIKIQDTVADNASCGMIVLGDRWVAPDSVDLPACKMVVKTNGVEVATGLGAAALGSPANAVAWLANTLAELGTSLKAGEIILSGSLVPLQPIHAGDRLLVEVKGIGQAAVKFV